MPRAKKKITLPERADMLRNLRKVDNSQYLVSRLYSTILQQAGRPNFDADSIIDLLVTAIHRCTNTHSAIQLFYGSLMDYVKALTDDEQVHAEAEAVIEARKRAREL